MEGVDAVARCQVWSAHEPLRRTGQATKRLVPSSTTYLRTVLDGSSA
jgi:hypothetical protein